jgi:anti-sigma factor RsiW
MSGETSTNCGAMRATISAYLDGDLDAVACEEIEGHCRNCSRCAALVEGLRETIGLCREAGRVPLPESVRERARASMAAVLAAEKRART